MCRLLTRTDFIIAGVAACAFFFSGTGATQDTPRPADPLTESERALAEQIPLADEELVSLLAEKRFRIMQIKLAELPKPQRDSPAPPPVPRRAEVIFYNYTDDVTERALVDLQERTVVRLEQLRLQPSLHPEELDQAFRIAQDDERITPILEGHQVIPEGLIVTDPAPHEPCFESRCVELQFFIDGEPSSLVVVVNLSAETVVRVR